MPIIVRTPDLTVGDSKIDEQHKQLFKAADDLAEAIFAGRGKEELEKTIDFLSEYTVFLAGEAKHSQRTGIRNHVCTRQTRPVTRSHILNCEVV